MPDPSLAWHPHVDVWAVVLALGGGYAVAVRRFGPRYVPPDEPPATRGQVTAFSLGVLTILIAADWPIHELAEERLFSVHMVQHFLLSLVAPPLLLLGTPGWLMRALLRPRWLLATVRVLSKPLVALLLFNGYIALSHWPPVVDLQVSSEVAHFLLHSVLVGTALLMWMPVLSPMAEIPRLSYPAQMLYLFAQSIVPTVPASFLTFAGDPLYPFYAQAAPLAGMDAVLDQRIAGLIMKLLGGLLLWGAIAVLFFRWHAREEATGVADTWDEVEREVNRMRAESR